MLLKKENIEWSTTLKNILAVSYTLWLREAWHAAVHEVTESWTQLSNWTEPNWWPKHMSFPGGSDGKEFNYNTGDLAWIPGWGRFPWRRKWHPLQYSCLEHPHGQRSLAGYILWVHKELDMTERLTTWSSHSTSRYLPMRN